MVFLFLNTMESHMNEQSSLRNDRGLCFLWFCLVWFVLYFFVFCFCFVCFCWQRFFSCFGHQTSQLSLILDRLFKRRETWFWEEKELPTQKCQVLATKSNVPSMASFFVISFSIASTVKQVTSFHLLNLYHCPLCSKLVTQLRSLCVVERCRTCNSQIRDTSNTQTSGVSFPSDPKKRSAEKGKHISLNHVVFIPQFSHANSMPKQWTVSRTTTGFWVSHYKFGNLKLRIGVNPLFMVFFSLKRSFALWPALAAEILESMFCCVNLKWYVCGKIGLSKFPSKSHHVIRSLHKHKHCWFLFSVLQWWNFFFLTQQASWQQFCASLNLENKTIRTQNVLLSSLS